MFQSQTPTHSNVLVPLICAAMRIQHIRPSSLSGSLQRGRRGNPCSSSVVRIRVLPNDNTECFASLQSIHRGPHPKRYFGSRVRRISHGRKLFASHPDHRGRSVRKSSYAHACTRRKSAHGSFERLLRRSAMLRCPRGTNVPCDRCPARPHPTQVCYMSSSDEC